MNPRLITILLLLILPSTLKAQDSKFLAEKEEARELITEAKALISKLERGKFGAGADSPNIGVLKEWNISVTSVAGSIQEKELLALYTITCEKIEEVWGEKLVTYKYIDPVSYTHLTLPTKA